MRFFEWDDRYRLGIEPVDGQHRRLVEMVDELFAAMHAGEGRAALERILNALLEYTVSHFDAEERWMARNGYPELDEHRRIHRRMREHVVGLKERYDAGKLTSPVQIGNFLRNWLNRHILGTDRKLADFSRNSGGH